MPSQDLSRARPETPTLPAGWRADPTSGTGGPGGFKLAAGRAAGRRLIDAQQLFHHGAHIGDAHSLAIDLASTTHSQVRPEALHATGVSDGYVRLFVVLEHRDAILADLDQALAVAGGLARAA